MIKGLFFFFALPDNIKYDVNYLLFYRFIAFVKIPYLQNILIFPWNHDN
jgi:hypothetical protein